MTVKDDLLKLRTGGTAITATEDGWTSTTLHTTGQRVVEIDKCPLEGIPIEVLAGADAGSAGGGGTMIVTIEASDTEASGYIVVATFPTLTQVEAKQVATRMVRRVATQKKYLRSVITVSGGDPERDFIITVGVGLVDDDASY